MLGGFTSAAVLAVATLLFLMIDLKGFARGREPTLREGVSWSVFWFVLSVAATFVVWWLSDGDDAVVYLTVYLIERSLSVDNLFVFLLLFAYFAIPQRDRARLVFVGIVLALIMRGIAILAGVALIERFAFIAYVLGVLLIALAARVFGGMDESVKPEGNLLVKLVRRMFPVTTRTDLGRWFVREDGRLTATPMVLCLAGIVFADLAFAVDSIPAAFGITRDPFLIWMGNVFALLGLRALFVIVEVMIRRFRFLSQTIAIVLGLVGVKLITEDLYHVGPVASLTVVLLLLGLGIVASILADRRDEAAGGGATG